MTDRFGMTNVVILNESTACPGQSRQDCYGTAQAEKVTRGALKASLDRALLMSTTTTMASQQSPTDNNHNNNINKNKTLVILDSLNYIKGFRYELYCLSKAAQQQHGVVWVLNSLEVAQEWNRQRREKQPCDDNNNNKGDNNNNKNNNDNEVSPSSSSSYSDELWHELVQRYEPPDERNRWDRPLFHIHLAALSSSSMSWSALEKSVYNMHELASVYTARLPATTTVTTTSDAAQPPTSSEPSTSTTAPQQQTEEPPSLYADVPIKKSPKARFKRAAKKPSPGADAVAAETTTTIMATPVFSLQAQQPPQQNQDGQQQQQLPTTTPTASTSNTTTTAAFPTKTLEEQIDAMLEQFLQSTQPLQQGMSTQQHIAHADANLMHVLDTVTQQVCRAILNVPNNHDHQDDPNNGMDTGHHDQNPTLTVRLPFLSSSSSLSTASTSPELAAVYKVPVDPRVLSWAANKQPPKAAQTMLQTWRRQYLQWCATHPPAAAAAAASTTTPNNHPTAHPLALEFCQYLSTKIANVEEDEDHHHHYPADHKNDT
ncbi:hypothetical protein ACA910_015933 [Epithemia clementina (nom. ined.)]